MSISLIFIGELWISQYANNIYAIEFRYLDKVNVKVQKKILNVETPPPHSMVLKRNIKG